MDKRLSILIPDGTKPREMPNPVRVLGVDLGTTNSVVAEITWHQDKEPKLNLRCLEVDQETTSGLYTHLLVPSAIAIHQGKEWIGEGAKRLHARAPEFGLELNRNLFLECKNDIGVRRTYHKAPHGYQSAKEIGGKVLRFLKNAAEQQDKTPVSSTVVTVPASFQAAQRKDTVEAARLAGIKLSSGELLDEPIAAFLDYLLGHIEHMKGALAKKQKLLVFDFGGGTCDVAIFELGKSSNQLALKIIPLAVSRYHRLGGGDIDRAILYDILLPQLLEQNGISASALTYEDKKNCIEPSLLGVAEALKIGLCNEVSRQQHFGRYSEATMAEIIKKQPGLHTCMVNDHTFKLQSPSLSAEQFEEILKPFLDSDLLYARETEYRLTCSIFAPIQDALDRSGLIASDIDLCLLVGGSSLIPQVTNAITSFLNKASLLQFSDHDSQLVSVARGAAYHALALTIFGRSIFHVAAPDQLSIRTVRGSYELIPKNTPLPYPLHGEWAQTFDLVIPETSILKPVPLLVEIIAGEEKQERLLFTAIWQVPGPVNKGDRLRLEYLLDENQVLSFRLTLADRAEQEPFTGKIENPLSNVVNPHAKRLKIQEAEEDLRTGKIPKEQVPDKVVEIARDYAELQHTEKAISYLKQALRLRNQPDPYILNLLGIYCGEHGDTENEEKYYREAARAGGGDASLFNLALSFHRRREHEEAERIIKERLSLKSDGPGLTLAARIADSLGQTEARDTLLKKAMSAFDPIRSMDKWALGWMTTASQMTGNKEKMEAAQEELRRRQLDEHPSEKEGIPPGVVGTVRKI